MFSIGKTTVWSISAFFAQVWQINDFGIRFGIILEGFWYTFDNFFRHHFFQRFWDGLFLDFWILLGDPRRFLRTFGPERLAARGPKASGALTFLALWGRPSSRGLKNIARCTKNVVRCTKNGPPCNMQRLICLTDFDWMLKGFGIHLGCIWYGFGIDFLWFWNEVMLSSVF